MTRFKITHISKILKHVEERETDLQKEYDKDNFTECLDILNECSQFPTQFATLSYDLQDDLIYSLLEISAEVDSKNLNELKDYYLKQCDLIRKQKERVKDAYNHFMFHTPDINLLTREGREASGYSQQVMIENLKYQDLKFKLSSYLEGYHYDRHDLYQWLASVVSIAIEKHSDAMTA